MGGDHVEKNRVSFLLLLCKTIAEVIAWFLQVKSNGAPEPSSLFGGGGGDHVERNGVSFLLLLRRTIVAISAWLLQVKSNRASEPSHFLGGAAAR